MAVTPVVEVKIAIHPLMIYTVRKKAASQRTDRLLTRFEYVVTEKVHLRQKIFF